MAEKAIGVPTSTTKPGPGESSQTCGLELHATALVDVEPAAGRRLVRQGRVRVDAVEQERLQADGGRRRERRLRQRRRAGDLRRGHRRAAQELVAARRPRRVDVDTRCAEVDRLTADVREVREVVRIVGRGDGDHVRQVDTTRGRSVSASLSLPSLPAAATNSEPCCVRNRDRVAERLREVVARPRVVRSRRRRSAPRTRRR